MDTLLVLHLEDNPDDAFFVKRFLEKQQCAADITHVSNREDFISALDQRRPDLILSDNNMPGCSSMEALQLAKAKYPAVPFLILSGLVRDDVAKKVMASGAAGVIAKDQLAQMLPILLSVRSAIAPKPVAAEPSTTALKRLLQVTQELVRARDMPMIAQLLSKAVRELTDADGATFILREGEFCHYVDEDAISPLLKGRRLPMAACISGWAMLNGKPALIEDVCNDPRIAPNAYQSTFVRSLLVVPLRGASQDGALGAYWADPHKSSEAELDMLQSLASATAAALENVRQIHELDNQLRLRTSQLETATRELEAYSYSVAHDLRSPLHNINVYAILLMEEYQESLDRQAREFLGRISSEADRMAGMIDNLHWLASYTSTDLNIADVNLSDMARENLKQLRAVSPERRTEIHIRDNLLVRGDPDLLKVMLDNLLTNAWKFTIRQAPAIISFGLVEDDEGPGEYFVRDNGVGFDMRHAGKLFVPFQQLHSDKEFKGTGLGLATVKRIVNRHGGAVRAESSVNNGATFYFSLAAVN